MADITEALNNYLHVEHDSGLLLTTISDSLSQENSNNICTMLLQVKYQSILQDNGWDLLTLLTPYLKSTNSSIYTLIEHITELCSPKEMYLALMEQFELTSDINTFTLLLPLLGNVLKSLPTTSGHLIELQIFVKKYGETFKRSSFNDIALKYKLHLPNDDDIDDDIDEQEHCHVTTTSLHCYIESLLSLLHSYIKELHYTYQQTSGHVIFNDDHYNVTERIQLEVIALLLELLDIVQTAAGSCDDDPLIKTIMNYIIQCHYGTVRLLEWSNKEDKDNEEIQLENSITFSQNGLSIFTYHLLTAPQYRNSLPHVMEPSYILQLCLVHIEYTLSEYTMSHDLLSLNTLILLEVLLKDINRRSLFPPFLEHSIVPQVIVSLAHTMYRCPFDKVRKQSYNLLLNFIDCFTIKGRYLIYKRLLIEVSHPGIQGLLIHEIKEEVHNAIHQDDGCCHFLGESLYNLYKHFLVASTDSDVLSEYDKLLGGLNFMRFLLLKDSDASLNKTYIWSCCMQLKNEYLKPLRIAVFNLQNYCKAKLQSPNENSINDGDSNNVQLNVSVIGKGMMPEMTPEEEMQTLYFSLHKLDIMLSVLARVEELI